MASSLLHAFPALIALQAYHGPSKGWKKEPVHKSPLFVASLLHIVTLIDSLRDGGTSLLKNPGRKAPRKTPKNHKCL